MMCVHKIDTYFRHQTTIATEQKLAMNLESKRNSQCYNKLFFLRTSTNEYHIVLRIITVIIARYLHLSCRIRHLDIWTHVHNKFVVVHGML